MNTPFILPKIYHSDFFINSDRTGLDFACILMNMIKDEDGEYEDYDDLTEDEIKIKYPNIHSIFTKKLPINHITVKYSFPLIQEIRLPYSSPDGFSIRDIAKIIGDEYRQFYEERTEAINNNRPPKYIEPTTRDLYDYGIRFRLGTTNHNRFEWKIQSGESHGSSNLICVSVQNDT